MLWHLVNGGPTGHRRTVAAQVRSEVLFTAELVVLAIVHFWTGVLVGTAVDALSRALSSAPERRTSGPAPTPGQRARYAAELSLTTAVLVVVILWLRQLLNLVQTRLLSRYRACDSPPWYDAVGVHMGWAMVFGVGCSSPTSAAKVAAVLGR